MSLSISILVPVYNASKHLAACLDSIVKQDYKDFEVIIVDDGSTDDSEYICDRYAEAYRQIKVIHQENKGVSATRQTLLDNACGDYILFVDADDYIDSNALSQLALVARQTKVDVIQCSYFSFDNHGEGEYVPVDLESRTEHLDILKIIMSNSSQYALWNKFIRKGVIDDNGIRFGEGISLGEDRCFLLSLYQNAISTEFLDFPFYHYRAEHYAKTSNSYALNTYLGYCNAVNVLKYLKRYVKPQFADFILSRFEGEALYATLYQGKQTVRVKDYPNLHKCYGKMSWPLIVKISFWLFFHQLTFVFRWYRHLRDLGI